MARILVIDDDPGTLESFGSLLRYAGHDVRTASSGRLGLEALYGEPYDLVLLDLS